MNKISNKLHADLENNNELIVKVVKEKKNKSKKMDRNEKGEPITKAGVVLKKNTKGLEALARYREQKKKMKEEKEQQRLEVKDDSESDDDDEYEIEAVEVKKIEAKVIEKEVIKEVEKEVIKEVPIEIVKPDLNVVKENENLKEKNRKLENLFEFNTHLNRISNLSRQTNLKF
jgi:hypothetical protein